MPFQTVPLFCVSEVFIPSKLRGGKIRKGEKYAFLGKAGEGGCDLGKASERKTDSVLRQIEFREEDIWRGLENDFFKTSHAQVPWKVFVYPQGSACCSLKSSALKDIGAGGGD